MMILRSWITRTSHLVRFYKISPYWESLSTLTSDKIVLLKLCKCPRIFEQRCGDAICVGVRTRASQFRINVALIKRNFQLLSKPSSFSGQEVGATRCKTFTALTLPLLLLSLPSPSRRFASLFSSPLVFPLSGFICYRGALLSAKSRTALEAKRPEERFPGSRQPAELATQATSRLTNVEIAWIFFFFSFFFPPFSSLSRI